MATQHPDAAYVKTFSYFLLTMRICFSNSSNTPGWMKGFQTCETNFYLILFKFKFKKYLKKSIFNN